MALTTARPQPSMNTSPDRWYHRINPCDIARFRALAPIGDLMAFLQRKLIESTECPCCRFGRVLAIALVAFSIGALL